MIISIGAEKAFDKLWHPFMIKTLSKLRIEANIPPQPPASIKKHLQRPTANSVLNHETQDAFPL